jgi:uncharacterized protein YdaU (DUF1376 family)
MNSLDWYPWHWKDWRLSDAYAHMDPHHRGIYRDLLDECWKSGAFALDFKALARVCGATLEAIQEAWPVVSPWFEQRPDGLWYNPNMADVRERQVAKHERLTDRASKGGQATKRKWQRKTKAYDIAIAKAISLPLSVEKERETERLSIESGVGSPVAVGAAPAFPRQSCPTCGGRKGVHSPFCKEIAS